MLTSVKRILGHFFEGGHATSDTLEDGWDSGAGIREPPLAPSP